MTECIHASTSTSTRLMTRDQIQILKERQISHIKLYDRLIKIAQESYTKSGSDCDKGALDMYENNKNVAIKIFDDYINIMEG